MKKTRPFIYLTAISSVVCSSFLFISVNVNAEENSTPVKTPMLHGKPDLTGVWKRPGRGLTPTVDENGSIVCILCPPAPRPNAEGAAAPRPQMMKPDRPNYKPEFMAKVKELDEKQVDLDPALRCGNPGLPRIGFPDGIIQHEKYISFMYNDLNGAFFRMIPIDGRGHNPDAEETFLGDSVGKWEGDTLVIEAVKFNDETWLIDDGSFHTKDLKVTERIRRIGNTIEYQATVEDPAVLAEPWKMRPRTMVLSDQPMFEPLPCIEQDLDHMMDATSHDNAR